MNLQTEHDVKSAIRFLKNLYNEIIESSDIKDLKDPKVLQKFEDTINFIEKMLST